MTDPELDSGPVQHRARFANRWVGLVVESLVAILLVAGAVWLIESREGGGFFSTHTKSPEIWLLILLVSALGTAGSLAPYYLGKQGTKTVFAKFPNLEGERWDRLQAVLQRWGAVALLLSAIPVLGIMLLTAAGASGIKRNSFLFWVFLGKTGRNWILLGLLLAGIKLLD